MEPSAHARLVRDPGSPMTRPRRRPLPRDRTSSSRRPTRRLATVLIQSGMITMDQLQAAQLYSVENHATCGRRSSN